MVAFLDDPPGWLVARTRFLVSRIGQLELLDRAYTLAAQSFVAFLPLILALAAMLSQPGSNVVAEEFIERFGLVGASAVAVQELIVVQHEGLLGGPAADPVRGLHSVEAASRAYNALWGTEQLPIREQWRSSSGSSCIWSWWPPSPSCQGSPGRRARCWPWLRSYRSWCYGPRPST